MITENDLLAAITADAPVPFDPAIHVTARMLAERLRVSTNCARRKMDKLVKEMGLVMITVQLPNGKVALAVMRKV